MEEAVDFTSKLIDSFTFRVQLLEDAINSKNASVDALDEVLGRRRRKGKKLWDVDFYSMVAMAMFFLHGKQVDTRSVWDTIDVHGA